MSKISINLVAYNGEKYLSACLCSVLNQKFRDFSLLVIDNGSSDKTREKIEQWKDKFTNEGIDVKVIYNDKNVGFAEGHNIGMREVVKSPLTPPFDKLRAGSCKGGELKPPVSPLRQAQGRLFGKGGAREQIPLTPFLKGGTIEQIMLKYICCLNQDIILEPDFLGKIVEFMDAHSDCGSACGKLIRAEEDVFEKLLPPLAPPCKGGGEQIPLTPFGKGGTRVIDSVGLRIFRSHRVVEKGQGEKDNGQYDKVCEVFGVSGALPVYRAAALEDVGMIKKPHPTSPYKGEELEVEYFDKDFFSYKEDVDLAYRLRWRGWKSFVAPQAIAHHKRSAKNITGRKNDFSAAFNRKNKSKFANYYAQRNQIFLLIKNLDKLNFAVFWYEFKKFGYELLFEWSTFKAWIDVFKDLDKMKKKRKWVMANRKVEAEEIEKWFE